MARKTALSFEDRRWVEEEIDSLVGELDARQNGHGLKHLATQRLIGKLTHLLGDGTPCPDRTLAERILHGLAIDGAWERVTDRLAEDKGTIAHNGTVLSIPSRIGARARRADGVQEKHYQQRLWWDWTWLEFEDWLRGQTVQAQQLGDKVAVMRKVLSLHDLYPDTKTPGEACERAGVDPREFRLDEAI